MPYTMFLDDIRDPPEEGTFDVICRSYQEAVAYVETHGFPSQVSFDHDLGLLSYEIVNGVMVERSGKDFANYLIDRDLDKQDMPTDFTYQIHSANSVGAINIQSILDGYLRFKRDNL